jgi:uncharacterized protein
MAKTIVILLLLIALFGVGVFLYGAYMNKTEPLAGYEMRTVRIGNTKVEAFVADTPEKRAQGLMEITRMDADTGMLFLFPNASPRTFWNKNTLMDLDLIWMLDKRVVGASRLPAITKSQEIVNIASPGPVHMVLEVPAGWVEEHAIQIGDFVE